MIENINLCPVAKMGGLNLSLLRILDLKELSIVKMPDSIILVLYSMRAVAVGNTNGGSNYFMSFQIQGGLHYTRDPLMNESVFDSKYAQLYVDDSLFATQLRRCQNSKF
ncbi:hypothetical protein A0J61_08108 [Choanephora cucurbitarum]|uniref:Uncharacterized protein n=1 Tax=Choanephora cucurbitarum TaxID=101091 RepID=A0A1C7N5B2_9FUNG|nr:hypothetical protein A0J61_08108 [Choanephora cucurbitarum]